MITLDDFFEEELVVSEQFAESRMRMYNEKYRSGNPIISDTEYDNLLKLYAKQFPNNSFLNCEEVEAEPELIEGKTVTLPQRMLSTDKAYSLKNIEKWADDVVTVGKSFGLHEEHILFRITPKLDGFAGFKQENSLLTRGNGYRGTDISHAFKNGLTCATVGFSHNNDGAGEIVVKKEYFKEFLAEDYENSRNVIASVIKEGQLDQKIKDAVKTYNIVFVPFQNLTGWLKTKKHLIEDLETIWEENINNCQFDTDGLVIETTDWKIKEEMGATNHHHKWQIAYKKNLEYHNIEVYDLIWQTSKSGIITPVVLLEPTLVSGVTIEKATGHNAGNVIDKGIGVGSVVRVCRSGLVIPYIESVVKPVKDVYVPNTCPSCGSPTEMVDIRLMCTNNIDCPAQIEGVIEFFFKTIGNCDGFGPKIIEKLCKWGYNNIVDIYEMHEQDFINIFGGKTAANLYKELQNSKKRPIEDWRFLAAWSLDGHGKGNCEKLLQKYPLIDIFSLSVQDIMNIDGFADVSATKLVKSLAKIRDDVEYMKDDFNLVETIRGGKINSSPIAGKVVVFTGTMVVGSRNDMIRDAKALGAKVGTGVTSKTDMLVCGTSVGKTKTDAARKNGTTVLSEQEYLELINEI